MSLVDVHNEWDPLEEMIVGVVDGARVPSTDRGLFALDHCGDVETPEDLPTGPYDDRVIDETRQDLEELAAPAGRGRWRTIGDRPARPAG